MLNKKNNNSVYYFLITSFFIIFILIGYAIQQMMLHSLRANNQEHVARLSGIKAQRVHDFFSRELNDIEKLAGYLDIKGIDQVGLLSTYGSNIVAKEGIIDIYGNLEQGESVPIALFPNIRESYRGKSAISFADGVGVLFTVPMLKDGNVQYVYYRFYNDQYVKSNFGLDEIDEFNLKINVVDAEDHVLIPYIGYNIEDENFFKSPELTESKNKIRDQMKRTSSAAIYFNSSRGDNYLFMSAIPNTELYLIGYIDEDSVAGGVFNTISLVILLYCAAVALMTFFLHSYRQDMSRKREELEERNNMVEQLSEEIMRTLAMTIDAKDKYTQGHSQRVAYYATLLAQKYGMDREKCRKIHQLGLLHDIGKIGVPDAVLNKEGKLSDDEFATIKNHTVMGGSILKTVKAIPDLWHGAQWHHERYDGRGYPDKKSGENIPLDARIIAVADSYDAMTSKRCYRDALPQDVVRKEIVKGRGTQFDPQIADLMLELIDTDVNYELRQK